MSNRNIALTILAIILLGWVAIKCLTTAWVALKLLPAVVMVLLFLGIGWFWGRFSK